MKKMTIKTLQPKPDTKIGLIDVPEDAQNFICDMGYLIFKVMNMDKDAWVTEKEIERDAIRFITTGKSKFDNMKSPSMWKTTGVPLPPGNWEFIATTATLTEAQARELVEGSEPYKRIWIYKDYLNGKALYSALESFASLLAANGLVGHYAILKLKS
jgi:hypothetical protein